MNPSEDGFLRRAIELALDGVENGRGGPFGAVVVRDGRIVGEGRNEVTSAADPTAHAEVQAIRAACRALGTHDLSGCTLFASCEPCPMCLASSLWARLDRIVYAATREDAARAGFDDAAFYAELARPADERRVGTEQIELDGARAPFEAWLRKADRRPY